MSGGADTTLRIWDCGTGSQIGEITTKSSVRTCGFSYSGNMAVYSTDKAMRQECEIFVVDVRNVDTSIGDASPIIRIPVPDSKVSPKLNWLLEIEKMSKIVHKATLFVINNLTFLIYE